MSVDIEDISLDEKQSSENINATSSLNLTKRKSFKDVYVTNKMIGMS